MFPYSSKHTFQIFSAMFLLIMTFALHVFFQNHNLRKSDDSILSPQDFLDRKQVDILSHWNYWYGQVLLKLCLSYALPHFSFASFGPFSLKTTLSFMRNFLKWWTFLIASQNILITFRFICLTTLCCFPLSHFFMNHPLKERSSSQLDNWLLEKQGCFW